MDESTIQGWSVRLEPGKPPVVYNRERGETIATVDGDFDTSLSRALLIARAPVLRDSLRAAVTVFAGLARDGIGRDKQLGAEMVTIFEGCLTNLGDGSSD